MPSLRVQRSYALVRPVVRRSAGSDGPGHFSGHAAVYGQRTLIGSRSWGFVERVAEGAFDRAIAERDDTIFCRDHDPSQLFGRVAAGTLLLASDGVGLAVDNDLPDTQGARDTAVLLATGDLRGMSFAFCVDHDEWEILSDDDPEYPGMELRTILGIQPLYDVSVVTNPAYPQTDAGLRSFDMTMRDLTAGRKLTPEQKRTLVQLVVDTDPLGAAYAQPENPEGGDGPDNDDPDLTLQDVGGKDPADPERTALLESIETLSESALEEVRGKIAERQAALAAGTGTTHRDYAERWMSGFESANGKVSV